MAKKDEHVAPGLPERGPNTIDRTDSPTDPVPDPPRGNAAEPTGQATKETARRSGNPADDLESEMHNVGESDRKGALGKTDVNLGQDTPVGGGEAEGRDRDDAA